MLLYITIICNHLKLFRKGFKKRIQHQWSGALRVRSKINPVFSPAPYLVICDGATQRLCVKNMAVIFLWRNLCCMYNLREGLIILPAALYRRFHSLSNSSTLIGASFFIYFKKTATILIQQQAYLTI